MFFVNYLCEILKDMCYYLHINKIFSGTNHILSKYIYGFVKPLYLSMVYGIYLSTFENLDIEQLLAPSFIIAVSVINSCTIKYN